jgi:hypothetical protein
MTTPSRIALFLLVLCASTASMAAAQTCMSGGRSSRRGSSSHQNWTNSDGDRLTKTTTIRLRTGDCELRVDARGDFMARPDLTGFATVDGYVEVEERDGDHNRKVRVSNTTGGLDYRWSLDGNNGFDVDRDRWLADALLAIERRTAWLAKTRVPLLLKQGGPDAVLNETYLMESDYAKRQYFNALLANARLSDANKDRILGQAADSMTSDYERAELLKAVAAQGPMSDQLARSVIRVAQRMSSDYEKRRALSAGLEAVTSAESRTAFFTAASTMSSSYELAELLIAAQRRSFVDSVSSDAYFKAVAKLSSDYERRRTLSALLKQRPDSPAILTGVLRASSSINSDFELASLLVEFAHVTPVRGELRELYLKAARSISSDFEYRRALQALLEQDRQT